MTKIKKILTLLILLSLNIDANPSYEESALINEYQKLLIEGYEFNDLRLNEIENLAISNNDYYFLRDTIAGSYLFSHKNRKIHSRNDVYKTFLEPNISNQGVNPIPISVLLVSLYEPDAEDSLLNRLNKNIAQGDEISKVHMASYFWLKQKYEEALNVLPAAYKNIIGINFKNNNELIVMSISDNSSATFLNQGDIIIGLNGKDIKTVTELSNELSLLPFSSTQLLRYQRAGKIFENEIQISKSLNINISPYRALILVGQGNINEAKSLANQFVENEFSLSADIKNSPVFKKLKATNDYVLCSIYTLPENTNIKERHQGIELCKQSLAGYETGILNENINNAMFEYTLNRFNLFWGIGYSLSNDILSSTYLKSFYKSGLGFEQDQDNLILAKKYIDNSSFLYSNSEILKTALIDIYKYGFLDRESQYSHIKNDETSSFNTKNALETLSQYEDYYGYVSRYHLIQMYRHDKKYKDIDKAFKYAELSYEKDKQYYISAFDYITMTYYGQGTSKDRKKAHELMIEYTDRMLEKKSFSESNLDDKWVLSALARDYGQDTYFEQDLNKFYYYYKDIYGYSVSMDKALFAFVIDGEVETTEFFLDMLLESETSIEFLNENNLASYVSYKAFGGLAPFQKKDIATACKYAANDININTNYISQYIYSYCVLAEEIPENLKYINYIKSLSKNGSSEASWYLYHIEKDKNLMEPNYIELKRYLTLAENQLSSNTSNALIKDFLWLDDPIIFDVRKDYLKDDLVFINAKIKEEEAYVKALQKAKDQKERQRLAKIRAANRQEAMRNTGNFLVDVLEFTVKAALVVGAVALAGDALEDSSPEVQQAFADSLSSSLTGSSQTYSNKYNSYQCTNARNELSSARRKLGLSNNLMGNMSCSNVGGSCMTPLPRQCYNRAASCRPGDYTCTSRENANYHNCQSQARIAAQNEKRRCEQRKQQLINQCNTRVNNNNRNAANFEIRQAQSKVNQYCY